ncbi:hypothetical protein Desor_2438 [Desulfosporosinus orientis DSM 765]|uniref:Uncharacterized protein n=1 Tax=Desulfosporosinus orientis (strain ATCC 19365 / DSM 765 / NCIMB 8382 / VKM B-1628 / Singapore I) TaxID=768706 RepID=G7WFC4_DESOD|nr:hypothetical protein [Desulfosporosinus orientis]AET68010.1 hypothetical protein Desor_2438 [Desulfosporosinus orientis DSM 765]
MRKTIAYLGYGLGLMLLVYYGLNYQDALHIEAGRNYDPFPLMLFSYVYYLIIGMYIALPGFIRGMALKGTLSVNWLKILILGIPMLLISASGILFYYSVSPQLNSLTRWIYLKLNMNGTILIGVACGYTLLNSIAKKESEPDTVPVVKSRVAKIVVLLILGSSLLYIALSGFLHPMKFVGVQADIVKNDDQTGYLVNDGKDTVYFIRTEINYRLKFENMPIRSIRQSGRDLKIKVEPQEELRSLFSEDIFKQPDGCGFSSSGKETEITLTYTIGSIDPEGNNVDILPPSLEVLEEIKDHLYNAELVVELSDTDIKRFNLLDYKRN